MRTLLTENERLVIRVIMSNFETWGSLASLLDAQLKSRLKEPEFVQAINSLISSNDVVKYSSGRLALTPKGMSRWRTTSVLTGVV